MTKPPDSNGPDINGPDSPHFNLPDRDAKVVAWQEISKGRFMPQRVRGSCQGRALGWTFIVPPSGQDGTDNCEDESQA